MQDAELNAQKGMSKSFVKYKQSLKNPTDEELKFHEFVHTAVKRREEKRAQMLKQRKEEALLAERQRKLAKEQQDKEELVDAALNIKNRKMRKRKKKKKKKQMKLIGQMFIDPGKVKRVEVNNENMQYYNNIYEQMRS